MIHKIPVLCVILFRIIDSSNGRDSTYMYIDMRERKTDRQTETFSEREKRDRERQRERERIAIDIH